MKTRILQIALRIALIEEEFSEKEIIEAVKLLKEQGVSSRLLSYLASQKTPDLAPRASYRKKLLTEEQRSQVVIELEKKDPEKYRVLSEFERLLRKGSILSDASEIRKLGERLSKDFSVKNSRTDMIIKLMALLADRTIEEIKGILQIASDSSNTGDNEYQKLADFIITGKTTENAKIEYNDRD